MANPESIRFRTRSIQEVEARGRSFGEHFLYPLVEGSDPSARQPVVAMYGEGESSKTTFVVGACGAFPEFEQLPEFRPIARQMLAHTKIKRGWNFNTVNNASEDRLYRFQDSHGEYFSSAGKNMPRSYIPRAPGVIPDADNPLVIQSRRHFSSSSYPELVDPMSESFPLVAKQIPGFDIVEHATRPHLEGAHIVVLVARHYMRSADYFEHHFQGNADESIVASLRQSLSPIASDIIAEFDYLRGLSREPKERDVSLLLSSNNPNMRAAFDRLREKINFGCIL